MGMLPLSPSATNFNYGPPTGGGMDPNMLAALMGGASGGSASPFPTGPASTGGGMDPNMLAALMSGASGGSAGPIPGADPYAAYAAPSTFSPTPAMFAPPTPAFYPPSGGGYGYSPQGGYPMFGGKLDTIG